MAATRLVVFANKAKKDEAYMEPIVPESVG